MNDGGFWPVADDAVSAWEALIDEPLKRYGIDPKLPGAKTARQFGYFSQWQGEVEQAVNWLKANANNRNSVDFNQWFANVSVRQGKPEENLIFLPKPLTSRLRHINRSYVKSGNERTLIPSLLERGATHIDLGFSIAFLNDFDTVLFSAMCSSIVLDFFVKMIGNPRVRLSTTRLLPFFYSDLDDFLVMRYLRLCTITNRYIDLWERLSKNFTENNKCKTENPLKEIDWRKIGLLEDYSRRQVSIEIDVLVAIKFKFEIEQLIQIYTVQFPVMKTYEEADQYDTKGRRLPNTTRKDAGAKELREALKKHDGISPATVSWEIDNGNQTVTKTFYPPFRHVDRIEDYKTTYRIFSERLGLNTDVDSSEVADATG